MADLRRPCGSRCTFRRAPRLRAPARIGRFTWRAGCLALVLLALTNLSARAADRAGASTAERRGEYVFRLSGGCSCHTDIKNKGAFLSGGRAIQTPFGTFYGANITRDADTGLGAWGEADFIRAMTQGVRKDGEHLFPAFPYTSFTRMTERDLKDLWAYLSTVPPVRNVNRQHKLFPLFGMRFSVGAWKAMYFIEGPFRPDPAQSPKINRGAYIVQALGHCAECHTPRNLAGAPKPELAFAGSADGPEGQLAPNITPDPSTGIGSWSARDIAFFLKTGSRPDGDVAGGAMGEMIEAGYGNVTDADLDAIAAYLKSLKPIAHKVEKKKR
jgi:mono/diheme cytochrome c family protein